MTKYLYGGLLVLLLPAFVGCKTKKQAEYDQETAEVSQAIKELNEQIEKNGRALDQLLKDLRDLNRERD